MIESKGNFSGLWSSLGILWQSPLAKQLLGIFVCVALCQTLFMSLISFDVLNAADSAKREYRLVRLSQQISELLQIGRRGHSALTMSFKLGRAVKYAPIKSLFEKKLAEFQSSIKEARIDASSVKELERSTQEFIACMTEVFEQIPNVSAELKDKLFIMAGELFRVSMNVHRYFHQLITESPPPVTALGLAPELVLYMWMGVSAMSLVAIFLVIENLLTGPISKLALDCEKIRSGGVMNPGGKNSSEISALQNCFHEMSVVVADSEMRRKSYIEILNNAQASALTQVNAWVTELTESLSSNEKLKRKLGTAQKNIEGLLRLVNSMSETLLGQDLSVAPVKQAAYSREIVENVSAALETLLQSRHLQLEISADNLEIYADPQLISRVLQNLISNAIKYSPDRGIISIEILKDEAGFCTFSIKDQGPGISKEQSSKLFSRFTQVEAADGSRREGSGLGLLISRQIVEAHGGFIGCQSQPGEGSRFWFRIPVQKIEKENKPVSIQVLAKKTQQRKSMKFFTTVTLAIYLLSQSCLAFSLQSKFSESTRLAKNFSLQKEILLRTQEMGTLYFVWTQQLVVSMMNQDPSEAEKALIILKDQTRPAEWILANCKPKSRLAEDMKKVCSSQKHLLQIVAYFLANTRSINQFTTAKLQKYFQYSEMMNSAIWDAIDRQARNVQLSFDFSNKLRVDLLALLGVGTASSIILLGVISVLSLRIIDKLNQLQKKARAFSEGAMILPTVQGTDELSFLDSRLCEVAADLKASELQRQDLLAVINHDLRTPLSAVLNSMQLTQQGVFGSLNAQQEKLLVKIEDKLRFVLKQINNMLLLEKLDSGAYEKIPEPVLLSSALLAETEVLKDEALRKRISLELKLDSNIEKSELRIDGNLLKKVLETLIPNALQASPPDSSVKISVELAENREHLILQVRDQGKGFNEELLRHVFDRFRFIEGKPLSGLGLPLIHRLCKVHGATITIDSKPEGSVVSVVLPSLN